MQTLATNWDDREWFCKKAKEDVEANMHHGSFQTHALFIRFSNTLLILYKEFLIVILNRQVSVKDLK